MQRNPSLAYLSRWFSNKVVRQRARLPDRADVSNAARQPGLECVCTGRNGEGEIGRDLAGAADIPEQADVRMNLLLCLIFAATTIHTDFDGGSLGRIEKASDTQFRLGAKGEKDQDGRNRQANWYYFRVDGAPKKEMILDIVDLPGEYNYKPNRGAITKDTPPVISYDQRAWKHIDTFEYDAAEPKLRLRITPAATRFWIAHVPPYTNEDLARLRADASRH